MQRSEVPRAMAVAMSVASELGLSADKAVILHDSDCLMVRLLPCDVVARVALAVHHAGAAFEVEVARRLVETGSPVRELEPRVGSRVYRRDGFAVTLWVYYEAVPPVEIAAPEYVDALQRLHAGFRQINLAAPHFMDRVGEARALVANRASTSGFDEAEREFVGSTLQRFGESVANSGAPQQLLHGEPHPGNLLRTKKGLLFIDPQTCCRGPVEFDIAHAPEEVGEHYRGANQELLRDCRILMLAMIIAWRWNPADQFPNGRRLRREWLAELQQRLDQYDGGRSVRGDGGA